MNRNNVIQTLIENARQVSIKYQSIVERWNGLVNAKVNNKEVCLPGYVPYIGEKYFEVSTKILIYALSQNLSPTDGISINWAKNWQEGDKDNNAINRQNINFKKHGKVMMHPFDTGHLPVTAAILRSIKPKGKNFISRSIYDDVAATNLSKYSFRTKTGTTTDNKKSLNKCFQWFSICEINQLNPDYVICAGNVAYKVLKTGLEKIPTWKGKIVKVSFPSMQVINRHFRKKLTNKHKSAIDILSIIPTTDHSKKADYQDKTLRDIIFRDEYYFAEMYNRILDQI